MITTTMLQNLNNDNSINRNIGLREVKVYLQGNDIVVAVIEVDDVIATDKWHNYGNTIPAEELTRVAAEINVFMNKWRFDV